MFLGSAGAECFFAPQEQNVSLLPRSNVSLLRRSRMFVGSAGATFLCGRRSRMFLCSAGAECFLAPQEQNVYSRVCSNPALRRSAMWRSLLGPQSLTLQRVDASDRW